MRFAFLDDQAERLDCTNRIIEYVKQAGEDEWGSSEMRIAIATRDPSRTPALSPYLVIIAEGLTEYIGMAQWLEKIGLYNYGRGFKCDNVFSVPRV